MKMNKAMLLATTAMTVFMNTAPITAFAQANDADKAVVEEAATETGSKYEAVMAPLVKSNMVEEYDLAG